MLLHSRKQHASVYRKLVCPIVPANACPLVTSSRRECVLFTSTSSHETRFIIRTRDWYVCQKKRQPFDSMLSDMADGKSVCLRFLLDLLCDA